MMTILELAEILLKNNNTFSQKLTIWGSEYISVNGLTFRKSDHKAKYEVDYEIDDYNEVIDILKREGLYREVAISKQEFIDIYLNGNNYDGFEINKEVAVIDREQVEVYNNSYGLFIDLKSAANNLYYELFVNKKYLI